MPGTRYDKEYYIACKDQVTGQMFRVRRFGRRHEINGRVYYESRAHLFTDGESGLLVPSRYNINDIDPDDIKRFVERKGFELKDLPIRKDDDEHD